MTERLTEVEARRASVRDLGAVTDVMRSLAAMRLQQALGTLAGTRAYAGVIAGALAQAVDLLDGAASRDAPVPWPVNGHGRCAWVLFAPEHGFVGGFAERLAEAALAAPPDCALWVVGRRGAALLEERGRAPVWSTAMATNTDAVTVTARRIAGALYEAAAAGRLGRVELLYGRTNAGAPPELTRRLLLPLDLPQDRFGDGRRPVPPLVNMPARDLIVRLVDEYVFALLADAAMESFAAENAARLSTMMTARHNIETTLDELTATARHLRQEQVTTELLELVSGAEAMG
ncbi:H+transporting two-sector ATPase gamma subunit (plasmid) [Azospirillum sp. B510]|uniref:F0F1 ATP synthase subunit gamma n=1 Tax=Azospirillum sp. (strain B510) TaxID=137722 RepID=UPI0001C4CBBD|nr:F0F1 ATP synthase subunit gamma [Azospirillum sp. B510]BAI75374.1 H+transporting two-sector ATPase gamma subunit [Azospirillum sp. B510]